MTTYNDEGLRYNDGLYHTFVAMRWQATSSVTVDDKWIGDMLFLCPANYYCSGDGFLFSTSNVF